MPLIRITLAKMHPSLRRQVEAGVTGQPDLLLIGDATSEINVMLTARDADVVIVPMAGGGPPAIVERLLNEYLDLGVVCIYPATGQGLMCRLQPRARWLTADSPALIADAIRLAHAEADSWRFDDLRC